MDPNLRALFTFSFGAHNECLGSLLWRCIDRGADTRTSLFEGDQGCGVAFSGGAQRNRLVAVFAKLVFGARGQINPQGVMESSALGGEDVVELLRSET